MNDLSGYLAAFLLPLFYTEIPSLVIYRSFWVRGTSPTRLDRSERIAREQSIAPFLSVGALCLSLWWLASATDASTAALDFDSTAWRLALLTGTLAGFVWLALYLSLLRFVQPGKDVLVSHLLLQHSPGYWIPLGLCAAIVEEVWRAYCLLALADHGSTIGIAVTASAAAWGHSRPRSRAISATVYAVYAAALFLATRSVWATIAAHAIVNTGTVCLIHAAYRRGLSGSR